MSITLVLIGAAALGGCGREPDRAMRRDVYASLEDCRADWGRVEDCELTSGLSGGSGTTTRSYYGPRYYWDTGGFYDNRPRPGSRASSVEHLGGRSGISSSARSGSSSSGSTSVSRGGFGSSASGHGSSS